MLFSSRIMCVKYSILQLSALYNRGVFINESIQSQFKTRLPYGVLRTDIPLTLLVPWQVHLHCRNVAMQPSESGLEWLALPSNWLSPPPPIQTVAPSPFWRVYRSKLVQSSGHLPKFLYTHNVSLSLDETSFFLFSFFKKISFFKLSLSAEELPIRKGTASLQIKPTLLQSF